MRPSVASLETLIGFALNGVVFGGIIALAAIGLTLVYGILKLSNFAHGDLLTLGAYLVFAFNTFYDPGAAATAAQVTAVVLVAWLLADRFKLHTLKRHEMLGVGAVAAVLLLLSFVPGIGEAALGTRFVLGGVLAMVWTAAFLAALDRVLWKPLRNQGAGTVTLIITSIGLALLIRNALGMVFGTSIHSYDRPISPPMELFGFRITTVQIWTLVVAALVVVGIHVLLRYTRFGKALRAVSDDPALARISGIDVDRMVVYVWLLSGALAALAGILLALNININTNLGWQLILPIFAAVILGGVGSVYGALLGAMTISIAMEVSVAWLPDSGYRFAVGFAILIVTMLVRPQGILGVAR